MSGIGLCPEMDACQYILLQSLSETDELCLEVVVREAKTLSEEESKRRSSVKSPIEGARLIDVEEDSLTFVLTWESYVSYVVHNESYALHTPRDRIISGRYLRLFKTSAFLDYLSASTFASEDYPGPLMHVEVACLNHIIDVASVQPPTIQITGGRPLLRGVD